MKLFQHDTGYPKITKKYLRLAAVYRRFAERSHHYDFSLSSLIDCYHHETYGKPYFLNNGYVHGKHLKDITVSAWIEDIYKGNFCKAEFLTPMNRWWAKHALDFPINTVFFPYRKQG